MQQLSVVSLVQLIIPARYATFNLQCNNPAQLFVILHDLITLLSTLFYFQS